MSYIPTKVTVRSKGINTNKGVSMGYIYQTHTLKELNAPRQLVKPMGFCLNEKCKYANDLSRYEHDYLFWKVSINADWLRCYYTQNHDFIDCPHCRHSLFWTNNFYRLVGSPNGIKYAKSQV